MGGIAMRHSVRATANRRSELSATCRKSKDEVVS